MLSQKQVALVLIDKHVEAYAELDVHQVYSERLTKAQALLIDEKVQYIGPNDYHVQSSSSTRVPAYYEVNGTCQCQDYARTAPHGWCKHRIAAKLYSKVLVDLQDLQRRGVPHLHCSCEHKSMMALCWAIACSEPMDQLCGLCTLSLSAAPEARWQETEDMNDDFDGGESVNGDGLSPASGLSATDLAAIAAPPYEPNPTPESICAAPGKSRKIPPKAMPMPEAPASLNLELKVGTVRVMYTARSMEPGQAGDQELETRLPGIMRMMENLALEDTEVSDQSRSWLKRMLSWGKSSSNDRY